MFGNSQERRRVLKMLVIRIPLEPWVWFVYHYIVCGGILEGRRGLIACQIRAQYIAQVHSKLFELEIGQGKRSDATGSHGSLDL